MKTKLDLQLIDIDFIKLANCHFSTSLTKPHFSLFWSRLWVPSKAAVNHTIYGSFRFLKDLKDFRDFREELVGLGGYGCCGVVVDEIWCGLFDEGVGRAEVDV